ncbi:ParB family chromosome partitioning protein [Paraburkholderia sp. JPY465]|uniref:ParB/RepB/Spo0J family partition protein n=2 Tax=unclassified Paraburkholderia TaxID=2615204 RepID=UPI003D246CEA
MGKSTSDADFVAQLRSRNSARSEQGMVLHTPPTRPNRSLDDLIADNDASSPSPAADAQPNQHEDSGSQGGELGRIVPIDLLDTHPWNARVHRSAERVREIASQIAAIRQLHPITVTRNPDAPGRYFVVDGETRLRGLKLLNKKTAWILEVDVDPNNPLDFYGASVKQTDATEAISAIDKGIKWAMLIEEGHATASAIAEKLELAPSTVSRMLAYKKFSPTVLDFMHSHADRFPYSVAAVLAQLVDEELSEEQILAKCQEVVDSQQGRRAVEALVKSVKTADGERKPRKAALIAIPIKAGTAQVGSFRTYESGALEFKLTTTASLSQENHKALSDVLETVSELISTGHEDLLRELEARLSRLRSDA